MSESRVFCVKLPPKHALDWLARYDGGDASEVQFTARTTTLQLSEAALCDLISDAHYYAEEMGPDNTGDIDYRPAARRCLAGIARAGITYCRKSFTITLTGDDGLGTSEAPEAIEKLREQGE